METTFYLPQTVVIPMALYRSMKGRYFTGCAGIEFTGAGKAAWVSLYNPADSGVNLHVDVWAVASVSGTFSAQLWLDSSAPGGAKSSDSVSASNFALSPLPEPVVQLLHASNAAPPKDGVMVSVRCCTAQSNVEVHEDGKYILPPEGSFSVLLTDTETPEVKASAFISLCWWEEPLPRMSVYGSRSQRSYPRKGEGSRAKLPPGG